MRVQPNDPYNHTHLCGSRCAVAAKARAARDAALIGRLIQRVQVLEDHNKRLHRLLEVATDAQRSNGERGGAFGNADGTTPRVHPRSLAGVGASIGGGGPTAAVGDGAVKAVKEAIRLLDDMAHATDVDEAMSFLELYK